MDRLESKIKSVQGLEYIDLESHARRDAHTGGNEPQDDDLLAGVLGEAITFDEFLRRLGENGVSRDQAEKLKIASRNLSIPLTLRKTSKITGLSKNDLFVLCRARTG